MGMVNVKNLDLHQRFISRGSGERVVWTVNDIWVSPSGSHYITATSDEGRTTTHLRMPEERIERV